MMARRITIVEGCEIAKWNAVLTYCMLLITAAQGHEVTKLDLQISPISILLPIANTVHVCAICALTLNKCTL